MARGFLAGVLGGGVVSTFVLGVVSALAPPLTPPEVGDAAPGTVQAPQRVTEPGSGKTPSTPDRAPVTPSVAQQALAPDPDNVAMIDESAQTPAAVPTTGGAESLDPPADSTEIASAPDADAPVLPTPQANAPVEPAPDTGATILTEPATPPAPPAETDQTALTEDTQGETQATDAADEPVTATAEGETDAPTPAPQADVAPVTEAEAPDPAAQTETAEAPAQPAVTPAPAKVPQIAEATDPEPDTDTPVEAEATAPADDTEVAVARPAVGTPAASLLNRDTGVTINRPQTTDTIDGTEPSQADPATPEGQATDSARPVDVFAQPFEVAEERPLMSIVLIDDGTTPTAGSAGIAALRSFPYPLSFAVDSSMDDAAERMALYRAEGFEVLAMIDLPPGAQPVDAETTLGVILPALPEVVGVLEGTGTGFQESRDLADQVSAILAQTGHGLLTQSRGLNTMAKLARKQNVPAAPVFRDFDNNDQSATVIRRFLDQAAFKAGQEGAVVMLGRMRPDTISALLLWGLQDRASSVALAPVSAVLKREP
ncbi:divergent polysaccharide deacetylase family protein [Sulfitobacter sp. JB4-11]|uniref:divergent polysaccharide deacetylase family protein n=1 Tax=Sulfitobacter rhodophyticola TaxID=3238304 RepID=UPI003518B898